MLDIIKVVLDIIIELNIKLLTYNITNFISRKTRGILLDWLFLSNLFIKIIEYLFLWFVFLLVLLLSHQISLRYLLQDLKKIYTMVGITLNYIITTNMA